jgi:hypothetical protein
VSLGASSDQGRDQGVPRVPPAEGPGSVAGAPNLPPGFADTFASRYVDTGEVRLHAVVGGEGPPLLLHGWPESWYAWRMVMPALARDFEVIAVDQRGIGLSDKPAGGHDTGTLAADRVGLMDALGHERFAVIGHDTGSRSATRWPPITRTGSSARPCWRSPDRVSPTTRKARTAGLSRSLRRLLARAGDQLGDGDRQSRAQNRPGTGPACHVERPADRRNAVAKPL